MHEFHIVYRSNWPLNGLCGSEEGHEVTGLYLVTGYEVTSDVQRAQHDTIQRYVREPLKHSDADTQ